MPSAITMDGLTKRYGDVVALAEVSLDVPTGSVFGFLGQNGAGKSTALRILAGLARASSGSATVDGIPVDVQGAHRTRIGYLAQDPRFYGWMTGQQTLEHVARFRPAADAGRGPADLLGLVGLADAADRPTREYSGGMRQRLGIAQALVGTPSVLLLDEPAAALDPVGRRDVLALIDGLRGELTVFFSTHILDDVQRVSDRVAILDRGRLVLAAPTADLLDGSTSTLRVALLGADETTAAALATLPGVSGVAPTGGSSGERRYDLALGDTPAEAVQRAVMRYASEAGLVVASNRPESRDLESVFLSIVGEERAA